MNWSDNATGEGLLPPDIPYIAITSRSRSYWGEASIWAGGLRFDLQAASPNDYTNFQAAMLRTGLPVFQARRDYRRPNSYKWERVHAP